jgi:thiol-disulfide isomerase/thioredoxin
MNRTVLWIVGGVVGLGLIVALAWSIAGEPVVDESIAFGEVTVDGPNLPFVQDVAAGDQAIGVTAPTVSGGDWNGNSYTVGPDGRPKVLVYLAHWCQFCDAEVPEVQRWLDAGNLPEDVDMYSFTIRSQRGRPDWPPQDWLDGYGWTVPTIMDDNLGSADIAYGVVGTPFYVVLDGDNTVLGRISGAVGTAGLEAMVQLAQDSIEG